MKVDSDDERTMTGDTDPEVPWLGHIGRLKTFFQDGSKEARWTAIRMSGLIVNFTISYYCVFFSPKWGSWSLPKVMVIVGFAHMALLILFSAGSLKKRKELQDSGDWGIDNLEVGSLVATTGYVHTLIGAFAALGSVGGVSHLEQLSEMMSYIGMALLTSIFGWWAGKEFERNKYSLPDEGEAEEEIREAIRSFVMSLQANSRSIDEASKDLSRRLAETGSNFSEKLENAAETEVRHLLEGSQSAVNEIATITATVSQDLSNTVNALCESLKQAANQPSSTLQGAASELRSRLDTALREYTTLSNRSVEAGKQARRQINLIEERSQHLEGSMQGIRQSLDEKLKQLSGLESQVEMLMSTLGDSSAKTATMASSVEILVKEVAQKKVSIITRLSEIEAELKGLERVSLK